MTAARPEQCESPITATGSPAQRRVAAAARKMSKNRGRARQVRGVFDRCMIPMLLVDSERWFLDANRAARFLFRMSREQLRARRMDDLAMPFQMASLVRAWPMLLSDGHVAGRETVHFGDGSELPIVYCALANLLPGQHLVVLAPAEWPEDELGPLEDGTAQPLAGPLSPREREVLSLVAAGADLLQIADELTISHATVRTHLGNAHRKLGAHNRAHAVALAMQLGLIDLPPTISRRNRAAPAPLEVDRSRTSSI
jgi:DNA-binding CsgD family transcriptional regulator